MQNGVAGTALCGTDGTTMKPACLLPDSMLPIPSNDSATTPRNLLGSRKRKAYMPRNSGVDEVAQAPCAQAPCLPTCNRGTKRRNTKDTAMTQVLAGIPATAPRSPQAASSKAQSSGADQGSTENAATSDTVAPATESLAATRSRRNIKPREKFDPRTFDLSGDCEAGDSRSCGSSDTLAQRAASRRVPEAGSGPLARAPRLDSATTAAAAASPRAWLSALVSGRSGGSTGCRGGGDGGARGGASDEQRMFQEFRKRTCTAYTGVVVHCQNMKLEARVNMVSYFPQRERKISGGQIYIAYMTNPHQAAVVHDITASIMTAPGIQIYHNHHSRPSTNREVALERLNYLDTLEVNMHRGCSRHNDKDQSLEKKARVDAENRRQVMLSPDELKRELHCWVSHDARWMTFKAWVEDVLFESKLANMCLKPKIINEEYLKADEQDLLRRHLNEYSMSSPPVFTHMYDSLVMEKVTDGSGAVSGYRLRSKRYRRRKPELRNGTVKWFDDKSYRFDLEDAPTEDDQRRLDIAWGVVRTWLRHYDPSLQAPPPDYDAVDANYYVTWSHFAEWVNTLLEHLPAEITSLQEETAGGAPAAEAERAAGTRRSARTSDTEVLRDRVERLQAVHDKFRAVVEAGERMPSTWSEAKPQHRQAFENFFAGWKPLPPSMSQPQRKLQARPAAYGAARSSKRSPSVKVEDAPVTRATTTTRSRATAQTKAHAELKAEEEANQAEERPAPEGVDAPPAPQRAEPTPALSPPTLPAQPTCSVAPATAPAQQAGGVPEMPAMCMGMAGIADVSQLRAWAVLNGLGQAVPMAAAQHTQQAQAHVAASFAAQSQQFALMQLQMQRGFNPCSVMPAPNVETAFTAAMQAATMPDTVAPMHLPPHALFTQPQHAGSHAGYVAGGPQAATIPPSPFLTTLDLPPQHLPTAESLLNGSLALPPPLSLKTPEAGTASVNDSARSCLTAAGSTPTAIDRPTLSRLLSNPMFAVPVAGAPGCMLQPAPAPQAGKPAGSSHE